MKKIIILLAAGSFLLCGSVQAADTFNLVIMASRNARVEGPKYAVLSKYIQARIDGFPSIRLKIAKDYPDAVNLFRSGEADGMFSGAFRGMSTFQGKRVAYTALASSGEIFARTLLKEGTKPENYFTQLIVKSHQTALNAVRNGAADYAIFKNLVWDQSKYPDLEIIGGDVAENPNNTLILTNRTYDRLGKKLGNVLTGLGNDRSPLAMEVKEAFKARTFIRTTEGDFSHTYDNIKKAHIDPETFNFSF